MRSHGDGKCIGRQNQMGALLEIDNIRKSFGALEVLKGVSLKLEPGLFGLLGPNGAGKSTLMRNIATLMTPDSGHIRFNGSDTKTDPDELRKSLGYLPQSFGVYPRMSALSLLNQLAVMKRVTNRKSRKDQIEGLLHAVNLWDKRHAEVATFSGGMRQRFGVAQALLGDPKLLIVDEPTAGLDLYERQRLLDLLSEAAQDKIIILSTHITNDILDLCPDMAVFAHGEVIVRKAPSALIDEMKGRVWIKQIPRAETEQTKSNFQVLSTRLIMGQQYVRVFAGTSPGSGFSPVTAELEDAYFAYLNGYVVRGQ